VTWCSGGSSSGARPAREPVSSRTTAPYWGVPDSSRADPPAGSASTSSLSDAVSALKRATDVLKGGPAGGASAERAQYNRHLEERGALRDVDEDTDLSSLPSTVTHVRHPDGRVERLGYS